MIRTLPAFMTIAAVAALSSCAPVSEPGEEVIAGLDTGRQCFFTRSVSGFSEAPEGPNRDDRIFVETSPKEKFLLEPLGACPDIDFALRIAIDERAGSSLCTGETATIFVPSTSFGTQRCLVKVVGKVTE